MKKVICYFLVSKKSMIRGRQYGDQNKEQLVQNVFNSNIAPPRPCETETNSRQKYQIESKQYQIKKTLSKNDL